MLGVREDDVIEGVASGKAVKRGKGEREVPGSTGRESMKRKKGKTRNRKTGEPSMFQGGLGRRKRRRNSSDFEVMCG